MSPKSIAELLTVPEEILCEMHEEGDACDVIVRMDDGTVYTALFATIPYIHRQLSLTWLVTESIPRDAAGALRRPGYAAYHRG